MTHRAWPHRVLIVEAGRRIADLLAADPALQIEQSQELAGAIRAIRRGGLDGALVAADLGRRGGGVTLVEAAVAEGCVIPLMLVAEGEVDAELESRALSAGAAGCLSLGGGPRRLLWALAFARELTLRHGAFLREVSARLTHEGKNAFAATGGALEILCARLPAAAAEREIHREVQSRLQAFAEALESVSRDLDARAAACGCAGGAFHPRRAEFDPSSGTQRSYET